MLTHVERESVEGYEEKVILYVRVDITVPTNANTRNLIELNRSEVRVCSLWLQ
jgi:hypothetical protein